MKIRKSIISEVWNKYRLAAAAVWLTALLCALFFRAEAFAEEKDTVVRVGYAGSSNFTGGTREGETKSGYAYEYMQLVAASTGWKYEYVYGEWSELLSMLERGEIDIMPGISKTEDRCEKLLFPNHEMGTEYYYMLAKDSSVYRSGDVAVLRGAKVGCVENSLLLTVFDKWNIEHGRPCELVLFPGYDGMMKAFDEGEVDIILETDNGAADLEHVLMLRSIGDSEYYLAVSKKRNDLRLELENCLDEISVKHPYLLYNMQYKYFSDATVKRGFTREDRLYLSQHPLIRIGYEKQFLSFCGYDEQTGECIGALRVFVDNLRKNYGSSFSRIELVPFDCTRDSMDALKRGEVDAVFAMYQCFYPAEQMGVLLSNGVASSGMTAIMNQSADFDEFADNTVAVVSGFTDVFWFLQENYPNWKIREYDTINDCLKAISSGEADCIIENTYVYKTIVDYRTIKVDALSKGVDICFAVNGDNTELLHILNQAIIDNPRAEFIAALSTYANSKYKTTLKDFARDNMTALGCAMLAGFLVLITLLGKMIRAQYRTNQAKEELSRALMQAEQANNAKTVFLNNMSHDIRTPMNAILGFTQLIKRRPDDREKILDYVKKIESSGDYLMMLINSVLDMARIESGKVVLDEEILDVQEIGGHISDLFQAELQKHRLKLDYREHLIHRYVWADRMRITQIMMNILSNAVKYTPDGGRIVLDFAEVESKDPERATYEITVSDTGIGMSKEFLEHIFDPFTRERTTTESKVIGTGLGMSIVKKLVDMMGGTIEVSSEPGKGTTFHLVMSHKIVNERMRLNGESGSDRYGDYLKLPKRRILIAEDNDLNAEIIEEILQDVGMDVERAADGVECVDMVANQESGYYDLILMDIQMPNLDGYDASVRIRSFDIADKAEIPILAMTANAFEEDKQKAYRAGMNGHLAKPIDIEELLEALRKYFITET